MRQICAIVAIAACADGKSTDDHAVPPANHASGSAQPDEADPLVDPPLRGPTAEVRLDAKLVMPAIPAFDVPPVKADSHSVRELRVLGKPLVDTDLAVTGIITWVYDCGTDVRKLGQSDRAAQDMIDKDPTLCERAK